MITPNNILIIRTDRIGDVILSLPLAALIKKHLPECKISFLLKEYAKERNAYTKRTKDHRLYNKQLAN